MARILLIDDSKLMLKRLTQHFESNGDHEIFTATNGQEALDFFQENKDKIEIIFTDLNMPVMDGFELITKIRIDNKTIPIVVCTANIQERTLLKAKEIGANDLIAKPDINNNELITSLLEKYL